MQFNAQKSTRSLPTTALHFVLYQDFYYDLLHHRHSMYTIDTFPCHLRPLGYSCERDLTRNGFNAFPQYKIPQMYRLHKHYNAVKDLVEFRDYKKKHLAAELRDTLKVIEIEVLIMKTLNRSSQMTWEFIFSV